MTLSTRRFACPWPGCLVSGPTASVPVVFSGRDRSVFSSHKAPLPCKAHSRPSNCSASSDAVRQIIILLSLRSKWTFSPLFTDRISSFPKAKAYPVSK